MKILLTGATGFVGQQLVKKLRNQGHNLVIVSRKAIKAKKIFSSMNCTFFEWAGVEESFPENALEGVEGVIHLLGEGIADKRWTSVQKERIYNSRILGTRKLREAIGDLPELKFLIAASGIGIYKKNQEDLLTEQSKEADDFLAKVCTDWEKEIRSIPVGRVCILRIAPVWGRGGGMIARLLPTYRMGLGGPLGKGKQWMSWIHLEDLISIINDAVTDERYQGIINAVAPEALTNREFSSLLAKAVKRPSFIKIPIPVVKIALGEMSQLALDGQRVAPSKLEKFNFPFKYPDAQSALEQILSKGQSKQE